MEAQIVALRGFAKLVPSVGPPCSCEGHRGAGMKEEEAWAAAAWRRRRRGWATRVEEGDGGRG